MNAVAALAKIFDEDLKVGQEKSRQAEKIEVARNSFKAGISVDIVAKITGLSLDELKQLQKEEML